MADDIAKMQEEAAEAAKPQSQTHSITVPNQFIRTFAHSDEAKQSKTPDRARVYVPVPGQNGQRANIFVTANEVKDIPSDPNHKTVLLHHDSYQMSTFDRKTKQTTSYGEFKTADIVAANVEANKDYQKQSGYNDKTIQVSAGLVNGPYHREGVYKSGSRAGQSYTQDLYRVGLPVPGKPKELGNIFVPAQNVAEVNNGANYRLTLTHPYTMTQSVKTADGTYDNKKVGTFSPEELAQAQTQSRDIYRQETASKVSEAQAQAPEAEQQSEASADVNL